MGTQVDVYYIHAPDPTLDLGDMLSGIHEAHKAGLFKRFGLSNFLAEDVERVHAHCKKHGYVLPTVYEGNYSPVARRPETELLPTLRRLGICFYVYSPLSGGFLTKTKQQVLEGADAGRFSHDNMMAPMYRPLYCKPAMLEALTLWGQVAAEAGCSCAELAYRWVAYNSPLDAELGDAVEGLAKGPLDAKASQKIDEIWKTIEHEAPVDNWNSYLVDNPYKP